MQKETSKLETSVNWIKPDKAYPKKSKPLVEFSNNNKNEIRKNLNFLLNPMNTNTNNDNGKSQLFDNETNSGLPGMKDLCPEDKQRIANLIKELAKIAEEKRQLEKLLEEERKIKDHKIKEVVKQHELLLNEKEKLLNKYTKTQEKLEYLKRHQKLMKLESNSLTLKPIKIPQLKIDQQNENQFNPHKSSTPVSRSPRNLSPIPLRANSVSSSESNSKQKINETVLNKQKDLIENDCSKKIELMKQRMDLMNEQKQLRELLDQQEKILKEKQDQIMMQQQLHRERLEQLAQVRKFELEQKNFKQQEILSASSIISSNNFDQPEQLDDTHEDKNMNHNDNNSILIEKIAQKVYKQLIVRRQVSTTEEQSLNTISNYDRKKERREQQIFISKNKPEKRELKNIEKIVQTNSGCVKIKPKQEANKISLKIGNNQKENEDDDLEESKLIEDLFFLNKF